MCGIIGYAGPRVAAPVLLESLQRLEYRGYDSAGIAVLSGENGGTTTVVKSERKVADLVDKLNSNGGIPQGTVGIGHTRWATHGRPTVVNAHPHHDCTGKINLIHNGIIENFRELKAELITAGHKFASDTDSEIVAHLIEENYQGDLHKATCIALQKVRGAYALVIMSEAEPDVIVGAKLNAPLVVGVGEKEVFISSDITALLPYTKEMILLDEGEVVSARPEKIMITDLAGKEITKTPTTVDWDAQQAQKGGYPHFMLKEIYEQPEALTNALRDRIDANGFAVLPDLQLTDEQIRELSSVTVVACGTAWYAGLMAKYAIEQLARISVDVAPASEFRYSQPLVSKNSLVIAISQSGETADTLAAVREAKNLGAKVVAITNVVGSALSREADGVINMQSGPEIAVCSTKAFLGMMACAVLLGLRLAKARDTLGDAAHQSLTKELQKLPQLIQQVLDKESQIAEMAQRYAHIKDAMYIGRGINYPIALEGALKLKEVSYVHAEGYAAGELKHGPIALLDAETPVVAVATQAKTLEKTVSNVQECHVRDAPIIAVVTQGHNPFDSEVVSDVIEVPACDELLSPIINVVPLQLFAYHMAVERGCDVDQPRNLAKSVTVE